MSNGQLVEKIESDMNFKLDPGHVEFLEDLRAYLVKLRDCDEIDLDAVAEEYQQDLKTLGPRGQAFIKRLGQDGWLGVGTPKEYGGQGRTLVEQWLFMEELKYHSLPAGQLLIQSIIPALLFLASEEVRVRFLPRCLSGDMMVAIGYSEPGAGTDLAALTTRAVPDADGYRVSGQKIWTTNAHNSTHLWLAARTGAPDSRHKGISLFILPMDSPGISLQPIITQSGERTNHVFFDEVFVSRDNLIGEENGGWGLIMAQLNFERMYCVSEMMHEFHHAVRWWKNNHTSCDAEEQAQLRELGRMAAEAEISRLMAMRTAWLVAQGRVPIVEASILKFTLTGTHQRNSLDALKLMGAHGQLAMGEKEAPANGYSSRAYLGTPAYTFGAGANELQRDMVAERGLGLARG